MLRLLFHHCRQGVREEPQIYRKGPRLDALPVHVLYRSRATPLLLQRLRPPKHLVSVPIFLVDTAHTLVRTLRKR